MGPGLDKLPPQTTKPQSILQRGKGRLDGYRNNIVDYYKRSQRSNYLQHHEFGEP